jgi:hypothetical protein
MNGVCGLPEVEAEYLLIPCGGTTAIGTLMRKAVLNLIENSKRIRIFDLAPFLAGLEMQEYLLKSIPPSRRIAISGCSECCPLIAFKTRKIDVGYRLSVDTSLAQEEAIKDLIQKVHKIMED